jgi:DDE superfamily endonuclease
MPPEIMNLLKPFAPVFQVRTWSKIQEMVIGAILAPGKRTVSSVLQVLGKSQETSYARYHHVLNRAQWSGRVLSERLLRLVVGTLGGDPLVLGIDEHIERRQGDKIAAKGIYRDGVRSSKSHFVKASGLRWISLMVLCWIPFAQRVWALPFLTVQAPSERYHEERGQRHKRITDWARQMIYQVRRWLPQMPIVVVGDNAYAALGLLHKCQTMQDPVTLVTRLRLDAALYEPAPPYSGRGRPRKKGKRLPNLETLVEDKETQWKTITVRWYGGVKRKVQIVSNTAVWFHNGKEPVPLRWVLVRDPLGKFDTQALLCTDLSACPTDMVAWFVLRWRMEVTFQEARAHLGLDSQRQWSDAAIARTTPLLLGLFSWLTLLAHLLNADQPLSFRSAAWYSKSLPTFSDAIAWARSLLWQETFRLSASEADVVKIPRSVLFRLTDTLCYAT